MDINKMCFCIVFNGTAVLWYDYSIISITILFDQTVQEYGIPNMSYYAMLFLSISDIDLCP